MVLFRVNDGWYGVDIMRVAEVIRLPKLARLPSMPNYVAGVILMRESLVPVMDLRDRLRLAPAPPYSTSRIIVLSLPGQQIGVLADEVSGVAPVAMERIHPTPSVMEKEVAAFLIGVTNIRDRLVALINIDSLLTPQERATLDRLATADAGAGTEGVSCS